MPFALDRIKIILLVVNGKTRMPIFFRKIKMETIKVLGGWEFFE
jgi:hypothetical protein